jgi:hypothetical protein
MYPIVTGETESFKKRNLESDFFKFIYHYLYSGMSSFELELKTNTGVLINESVSGLPLFNINKTRYEKQNRMPSLYNLQFTDHGVLPDEIIVRDIAKEINNIDSQLEKAKGLFVSESRQ